MPLSTPFKGKYSTRSCFAVPSAKHHRVKNRKKQSKKNSFCLFYAQRYDRVTFSLDRDHHAAVTCVLLVRQLDVQVGDVHAVQLAAEVLVVAGGLLSLVLGAVERASWGEMNRDLLASMGPVYEQRKESKSQRVIESKSHRVKE